MKLTLNNILQQTKMIQNSYCFHFQSTKKNDGEIISSFIDII